MTPLFRELRVKPQYSAVLGGLRVKPPYSAVLGGLRVKPQYSAVLSGLRVKNGGLCQAAVVLSVRL